RTGQVALTRQRTNHNELPPDHLAPELPSMLTPNQRQSIICVIAGLGNEVCPVVPGVFNLVVISAIEGDSTKQWRVAIHNSQSRANIGVVSGRVVSVHGADKSNASLIDQRGTDGICPANGGSPRMI